MIRHMLIRALPAVVTSTSLVLGIMGIVYTLEGNLQYALYAMALAACADGLDGPLARALGVQSDLGKQLDSLADMVSFGVLPSLITYALMHTMVDKALAFLSLAIAVGAMVRLARFNLDKERLHFVGLPTPAAALWVGLLANLYLQDKLTPDVLLLCLVASSLGLALLMNAPMQFWGPKHWKWPSSARSRSIAAALGISALVLGYIVGLGITATLLFACYIGFCLRTLDLSS